MMLALLRTLRLVSLIVYSISDLCSPPAPRPLLRTQEHQLCQHLDTQAPSDAFSADLAFFTSVQHSSTLIY